jgi:formylglycine-generating enzyme required for sulfatase activity
MNIKRFCLAFAPIVFMGCENANDPLVQSQKLNPIAACLKSLPTPVRMEGGQTLIGSDSAYPEERPKRNIQLAAFEIDASEVTNGQFAKFVKETGFITEAEKLQAGFEAPGGAVFSVPTASNPSWWRFVEGANWKHPEGPNSTIEGKELEPVVQVTLNDARAYSNWAGRRLPIEEEWEYAAKAGSNSIYVWGNDRAPDGQQKANTWQGAFPIQNTSADGFSARAPIGCFEPNAFGLYDMIGNVWEWTDTAWGDGQSHVIKGGSFLCAENYCRRYRASARQPQEVNFSTNHIGFRTVRD